MEKSKTMENVSTVKFFLNQTLKSINVHLFCYMPDINLLTHPSHLLTSNFIQQVATQFFVHKKLPASSTKNSIKNWWSGKSEWGMKEEWIRISLLLLLLLLLTDVNDSVICNYHY